MNKNIWNSFAPVYDVFMRKDHRAYEEMYKMIGRRIRDKRILEAATGTGLIARNIAPYGGEITATDFSEDMIRAAKKRCPANVGFRVENVYDLSFENASFDVVILSNALHILDKPEKALKEISRVLRADGLLIAPTFVHGRMSLPKRLLAGVMGIFGFEAQSKWTGKEYIAFLEENGWCVEKARLIRASFPLIYAECKKASLNRR